MMRRVYLSLPVPSPAPNFLGKIDRNLPRASRKIHSSSNLNEPQSATVFFNQFPSYCQMVEEAKKRARRSILIDHNGVTHIQLNQFNNVEQVYTIEKNSGKRAVTKLSLIEFVSEKDADEVMKLAWHQGDRLLPVPMKIFCHPPISSAQEPSKQDLIYPVKNFRLSSYDGSDMKLKSYSDLISRNTMSLVALKMRFITLVNLEQLLCSGLFGAYELMPFGSSVIDTGTEFGDLDLLLTRRQNHNDVISRTLALEKPSPLPEPPIKLLHLDKSLHSSPSDKLGEMTAMRLFETIFKSFVPLTDERTLFFSTAKVPIIRFKTSITEIDCDLSFNLGFDQFGERDILTTNYSSVIMSQILYDVCRKNNLFTAVVIYLRIFAKLTSITSKGSTAPFTNFQLLSLIIFYLQQESFNPKTLAVYHSRKYPIIPPFREIMNSQPILLDDDQLNVVLPRLIKGFFDFYSHKVDLKRDKSLDLYNSKLDRKPDNSILYVINPLDRKRNVCHNVIRKGLDHFLDHCKRANLFLSLEHRRNCPLSLLNHLASESQQRSQISKTLRMGEALFEDDLFKSLNT